MPRKNRTKPKPKLYRIEWVCTKRDGSVVVGNGSWQTVKSPHQYKKLSLFVDHCNLRFPHIKHILVEKQDTSLPSSQENHGGQERQ